MSLPMTGLRKSRVTNRGADETKDEARLLVGASRRSRQTGHSTEVGIRPFGVAWRLLAPMALACSTCPKDVIIQGFPLGYHRPVDAGERTSRAESALRQTARPIGRFHRRQESHSCTRS